MKLSLPLKFVFGVYVNVPSALRTSVPLAGATTGVMPFKALPSTSTMVRVWPSGSLSWPTVPGVTSPVIDPSSLPVKLSSTAVGAELPELRVRVTTASSVRLPSERRYENVSVPVAASGIST